MTKAAESHLSFLLDHQPFPAFADTTQANLDRLFDALEYFSQHKDARCIRPVLFLFKHDEADGAFSLVEDVLAMFDAVDVEPHLVEALTQADHQAAYWPALISWTFPSAAVSAALAHLLQTDLADTCFAAATGLLVDKTEASRILVEKRMHAIEDSETREELRRILGTNQRS